MTPYSAGKQAFTAGQPRTPPGDAAIPDDVKKWLWGYDAAEFDDLLSKTPVPDLSLIAEAENLIPRGFFWCGHELNRSLHFYRDHCASRDAYKIKLSERTLRQAVVRARWEAAGMPHQEIYRHSDVTRLAIDERPV